MSISEQIFDLNKKIEEAEKKGLDTTKLEEQLRRLYNMTNTPAYYGGVHKKASPKKKPVSPKKKPVSPKKKPVSPKKKTVSPKKKPVSPKKKPVSPK